MKKLAIQKSSLIILLAVVPAFFASIAVSAAAPAASSVVMPKDPTQSGSLVDRLNQRKSIHKIQLTIVQQRNITGKCAAVQQKLKNISTKDRPLKDTRGQLYKGLADRLADIINQLQKQGIDVSALVSVQQKFNDAINKYLVDVTNYETALSDAAAVDCTADPAGFDASLLETRQLRAQLKNDASAIRSLVPELAKELVNIKQAMEAKNSAGTLNQ